MALSDDLFGMQMAQSDAMRRLYDNQQMAAQNALGNGLLGGIAGGSPYGGITADDYRRRSQIDFEAIRHREQYERHKVMMDRKTYERDRAIDFCNRNWARGTPEWDLALKLALDPKNEGMDIVSMVEGRMRKRKHNIDEVSALEYLKTKNDEFVRGVEL